MIGALLEGLDKIVLKPGSTGQLGIATRPGLWKNKGSQKPGWPGDHVDLARPGRKLDCNPLTIYFFNQNDILLIYKKKLGLTRWPSQNPWPGPGLKTLLERERHEKKSDDKRKKEGIGEGKRRGVKKSRHVDVQSPFYRMARGFKLIYKSFNEKK